MQTLRTSFLIKHVNDDKLSEIFSFLCDADFQQFSALVQLGGSCTGKLLSLSFP